VSDLAAADRDVVEADGRAALDCHLCCLELMMVPVLCLSVFVFLSQLRLEFVELLTGLELHCDGLVGALHEKSAFSSQSGPRVRLQAIFQHMACARAFSGRRRT
jgi:hypothetical protein